MLLSDSSVSIMVDMVGMLSLSIMGEMTLMLVMVLGRDMLGLVLHCHAAVCDHGEKLLETAINISPPIQGWRSKGMSRNIQGTPEQ